MYEKMKKELVKELRNQLADTFRIATFKAYKDGKEVDAFYITEENSATSPTFYFKNYLNDYNAGIAVNDLVKEIIGTYYFAIQQSPIEVNDFKDFEKQKDKITYKLVNTKEYSDQLNSIPHVDFFDLSIIFYCILDINNDSCMSFTITNNIMELWGINKDTLYEIAQRNLPELLPLEVNSIIQVITSETQDFNSTDEIIKNLPNEQMYVVTNKYRKNGFVNIFCPDLLKTFSNRFGSFYILPSSTDESLFVPISTNVELIDLKRIVRDANESVVEPDLFLSNSVYYYDNEKKKIDAYLV